MKPHDEIFRAMASDPGSREDLLKICTPDLARRVDMSTVRAVDATFTGGKQADLLLSMTDGTGGRHLVYILVEHKSYHDRLVAVQLLRYLGAIWQQQWVNVKATARGSLPLIHPVVFYHGRRRWRAPLRLSGLHGRGEADGAGATGDTGTTVDGVELPRSGFGFPAELEYRLVDLRTIRPERLRIRMRTIAFLITLRHVLRPLNRRTARKILVIYWDDRVDGDTRTQLLEYLFHTGGNRSTDILLTAARKAEYTLRGGKSVMTIAQELERRGREKGLREGREEGRLEAARIVARNLLDRGLSVELIAETTGLTREQVIALQREKS